jgi:hypothetical protein
MIALLLLAVIVGVAVLLLQRATRGAGSGEGEGVWALRAALQHVGLLAALFTAASGVSRLVGTALPGRAIAGSVTDDLALGLSLTLVAGPAWALLWRSVAARLRSDPEERSTPSWPLHLVVATAVPLIIVVANGATVLRWLLGVGAYRPEAVAATVVWTAVWALAAALQRSPRLQPTGPLAGLPTLAGAAVGLVSLALGAGITVRAALDELYVAAVGTVVVDASSVDALRSGLAVALVAAPVWWWHWLRGAVRGPRDGWWHGYVMLLAVLGGSLTALAGAGTVLHAGLQWLIGRPEAASAAAHFQQVPPAVAGGAVGALVWGYHRAVLAAAEDRRRTEPERAATYLVAGVGLVAAGSGVAVSIMAALQALVPAGLATTDPGGRNTLVAALALLLVGGPVWGVAWRGLQRRVRAGESGERAAPSRRAYLALLFGATGLTALISLAVILFVVLRDLLDRALDLGVLADLRAAIGLVLTAGTVSAYHWTVHRADRRAADAAPARPRRVLLVSADGRGVAAAVAARTGARVRSLHRLDAPGRAVDVDAVSTAILGSPHERLLVTVDPDGAVHVIPYEPTGAPQPGGRPDP